MSPQLDLEINLDGTTNVIVRYKSRAKAEFGLDFYAPENIKNRKESLSEAIAAQYKGLTVNAAKIMVAGVLVAVIPLVPTRAVEPEKYSGQPASRIKGFTEK